MSLPQYEKLSNIPNPVDFGLGGPCKVIPIHEDLNTCLGESSGFYCGYSLKNAPNDSTAWIYIQHMYYNNDFIKQIAYSFFSNNTYVRTKSNGEWLDWEVK